MPAGVMMCAMGTGGVAKPRHEAAGWQGQHWAPRPVCGAQLAAALLPAPAPTEGSGCKEAAQPFLLHTEIEQRWRDCIKLGCEIEQEAHSGEGPHTAGA